MKNNINHAKLLIKKFNLIPHPEGGYFKQTHKSELRTHSAAGEPRSSGTSIYYLLSNNDFSAWHRIKSDETWNFHSGSTQYPQHHSLIEKLSRAKLVVPMQN